MCPGAINSSRDNMTSKICLHQLMSQLNSNSWNIIINIFKCFDNCLNYSDLVELNINIFVVNHKVFSKSSTTFSIWVNCSIFYTCMYHHHLILQLYLWSMDISPTVDATIGRPLLIVLILKHNVYTLSSVNVIFSQFIVLKLCSPF